MEKEMKQKRCSTWVVSLSVVVAAALIGLFVYQGLKAVSMGQRVVTVKGAAELEVKADVASMSIRFAILQNTLQDALRVSKEKETIVIDFLKEIGFTDDEIFVGKVSYDEYENSKTKYVRGSVRLFVKSKAIEKVQTLEKRVTELYERGVVIDQDYWDDGASYEISDVNVFKPKLITESLANAKKAGEQFAKDAESKLGKMKTAWQGQISIEDLDETTPHIKKCRVVSTITYYLED
ncbi:MAG: SIMPL domain-containing protein [Bacteroidales bacterium]|nr:SIMPL domain-containing protein [Bacteroidales bacterium]